MFATELVVPNENISSIISVLEFYADEDKAPEENLKDCVSGFYLEFVEKMRIL